MAAIDAETKAARKRVPGAAAGWLTGFFANLSPRTLAVAASFAVLAIALQAFMLVDIFTKPQGCVRAGLAWHRAPARHLCDGAFRASASAAEITNFLQNYQAALVDGPTPGGLYRVRIADEVARQGRARPDRRAHAPGARRGSRPSRPTNRPSRLTTSEPGKLRRRAPAIPLPG